MKKSTSFRKNIIISTFLLALIIQACETSSEETAKGACTAPDSSYSEFTYATWNNLNYALPYCWTANEVFDKTGASTLLRLDHGEWKLSVDITVTENQGDATAGWGPPENLYGEYYYYDFLVNASTKEIMRFEDGTKISAVTQYPVPEDVQDDLNTILSSLSLIK